MWMQEGNIFNTQSTKLLRAFRNEDSLSERNTVQLRPSKIAGLHAVVVVCVVYVPLKLLLVRSLSGKQTIVIHEKHQLHIALTFFRFRTGTRFT